MQGSAGLIVEIRTEICSIIRGCSDTMERRVMSGNNRSKGYRKRSNGVFEVEIWDRDRLVYLGRYKDENEAIDVVRAFRECRLITILAEHGHNINDGKTINEYYIVFNNGDVFNKQTGHKLKSHVGTRGYVMVDLNHNICLVHRLVAESFVPNPLNKPCVNHINGIKTDNRAENLEWCTHSENNQHAYDNNLSHAVCGEKHYSSKFTQDEIREIRRLYKTNKPEYSQANLARKYGVGPTTMHDIVHNKRYKEVLNKENECV